MIDRRTLHPMKAGHKNLQPMIAPPWRLAPIALGLMALAAPPAWSLPVDPTLVAGSATISQPQVNALLVNQSSQSAQIDWRSFNIASGERVQFVQPNASSVIFNKVLSSDPSSIFGTISANGRVFLINPAGIIFGPTAVVDTGSLVATALDVRLDPANPDHFSLVATTDHPGRIENQGLLTAAQGGVVALIGGQVANSGSILTPGGTTALVAAARVTLDFAGDKLLSFEVDPVLARASIRHSGRIEADGGDAVFAVRARDALLDTVLNVEGVVRANRLVERNGTIHIDGGGSGVVRIGGQLDASGIHTAGGVIEVTGDKVLLDEGATLVASGTSGGGTIHVGGDWQGSGPLNNASMTHVAAGTRLEADATESGNGGEVVVWSNGSTRFFGHAQAQGGLQGGDGGRGEVSGKGYLDFQGTFSASAPQGKAGTLLLDPLDITISDAEHDNGKWVEQDGAFKPSADPSVLSWATLKTALGTSDVTVTTADNGGEASGNITVVKASPDLISSYSLTLKTADKGKIDISAAITNSGGGSLILNAGTGGVAFNADVTISGGMTVTGATTINTSNVSTGGMQSYENAVTLGADTTLTGNTVKTLGGVTGDNHSLSIVGDAVLGGPLSGLTTLTVSKSTTITGGTVISSGKQEYLGDVTIAGATTLSSGGGDVTFKGSVDGASALGVYSSGTTTFSKAVGGKTGLALASLKTDAGGSTAINGGAVRTSGEQSYGDAVTLGADTTLTGNTVKTLGGVTGDNHSLSIVGDAVLGGTLSGLTTLAVSKSATITGGTVSSSGKQEYGGDVTIEGTDARLNTKNDAVTIAGATTLSKGLTVSSGVGDVTFSGTVDGASALEVKSGGTTIFSQAVGASKELARLTTDAGGETRINGGSVRTSGEQSYGDAVMLGAETTLSGNNVGLGSTVDGEHKLTVNDSGTTTFGGVVGGGSALASLMTYAIGETRINGGSVRTSGEQSYGDAVTLGTDITLTGSKVNALGGVEGAKHSLSIFGDAVLGGTLSGLTTLTVSKSTTIKGGTVTSSGKQEYLGDVTIEGTRVQLNTTDNAVKIAGATTLSNGAGDVTFSGAVDGPGALVVNSSGTTTFSQAVGASKELARLTTDAGGETRINGGSVRTSGEQSYGDAVMLGAETTLSGNNVSLGSTVDGEHELTVNDSGTTTFGGVVGGGSALASLTTYAVGETRINGGSVRTSGEQSYGDGVTLGTDTTLTGSKVKTLGGVEGAKHSLSIFGDAVLGGTLSGLTTLTVSKSTTITGGTVSSSGMQEYLGDVTIAGATTLSSSGAGGVTFHGKVDGPSSLSLNSQGNVTFSAAVGSKVPLTSLSTDKGGELWIKGGLVHTDGKQSYGNDVVLYGDTTLHVTGSDTQTLTVKGEHGFSFKYYDNAVELRDGGSITNQSGSRLTVVVDGPGSVDLLSLKPKDGSSSTPSLAELITKAAETLDPSSNAFSGLMGWTTRNDLQGEVTVVTGARELLKGQYRSLETQYLVGVASPKIEIAKFGGTDERADIGILADSVLLMTRALPISRPDGMVDTGIIKAMASVPADAVVRRPYLPALTVLSLEHEGQGASQPYYYGGADKDLWIPVELGVDSQHRGLVVFLPPQNAGGDAKWLYLGGPEELKPIMSSSSLVRYGAASVPVIYNGEIISSAQFAGFEASLVQLLSDIRREQLERGYANESIPARLRTGVVMETGLGSPAVDEFEGVALPARCTGTVSASGMSCAN